MKIAVVVLLIIYATSVLKPASITEDHNEHYTLYTSVKCEDALNAVSDRMEAAGVSWNSTRIGGSEFDNADNEALGFKAIGIGSVAESDEVCPYVYYIVEFDPESVVLNCLVVGSEFRLYREATDDYPAGEMIFEVSAVKNNCVLCVVGINGPVTCDSSSKNDWVTTAIFEVFANIEI